MARHQLFFADGAADPTLLTVVFQRVRTPTGAELEAKAFVVWSGSWQAPFWEHIDVETWPGAELEPAVAAWQEARTGGALRLEWEDTGSGLAVSLRTPSTGVEIEVPLLSDAGVGDDPHGPVHWRTGLGTVTVNGASRPGRVVVERFDGPAVAQPEYGTFEMWMFAPEPGGLTLGRDPADRGGAALVVAPGGGVASVPFAATALTTRTDPETAMPLPTAWRLGEPGTPVVERVAGTLGRGHAPDGRPALYDIGWARGERAPAALVFHLTDAPVPPP